MRREGASGPRDCGGRSALPIGQRMLGVLLGSFALICALAGGEAGQAGKPVATLGVSRVDITPAQPVLMSGYEARKTPSTGVHDPLFASALRFNCGATSVLLITADVIGFGAPFIDDVKARISAKTGIPPANIMLCAVHNHGGPAIKADEDHVPGPNEVYIQILKDKLVGLAAEASRNPVPFRMGLAKGACRMNINPVIKDRSPFSNTVIVTHCNGSSGYICTDKAFSEGGYEVQVTRLMPGAEKPLVRRLLELVRSF